MEPEALALLEHEEQDDPNAKADSDPYTLYEVKEDPYSDPVSVLSSSDREVVTMPGTTLRGVPRVSRSAFVRVVAPGGT